MSNHTLSSPVGKLMRPTVPLDAADSLHLAAERLRDDEISSVPVVKDGRLIGVLTQWNLGQALGNGAELSDAVSEYVQQANVLRPHDTGAEALRRLSPESHLIVVDDNDRVIGTLNAADLYPHRLTPPRPNAVGGMATPFGVYLTTGTLSAGAPKWALAATGAAMFLMLEVGIILGSYIGDAALTLHLPMAACNVIDSVVSFGTFLALMRFTPLSSIHGAEHQVVHAIEREEALTPTVVRRMPRVHPRCGTNFAVWIGVYLSIATLPNPFKDFDEIKLLFAVAIPFLFWRSIGSFAQEYITTKRPSDKHLAFSIEAGKSLLEKHASAGKRTPTVFTRIWNSGLLLVLAGSTTTALTLSWVAHIFGWHIPGLEI